MEKGYYKIHNNITVIEKCENLQLSGLKINEIVIPDGVKCLYLSNNRIRELILPSSLEVLYCDSNKLEELELPNKLTYLNCSSNRIKELIVPDTVKYIGCRKNRIEELKLFNSDVSHHTDRNVEISYSYILKLNIIKPKYRINGIHILKNNNIISGKQYCILILIFLNKIITPLKVSEILKCDYPSIVEEWQDLFDRNIYSNDKINYDTLFKLCNYQKMYHNDLIELDSNVSFLKKLLINFYNKQLL